MITVLCLALAGCGAATEPPAETENSQAKHTTSAENPGSSEASPGSAAGSTSGIDNKNPKQDADGMYVYEDGSYVFVGFQQHFSEQTTEIYIGASSGPQLAGPQVGAGYTYCDLNKMDYIYDGQKTPISLEFMILCAYAVEHNAEEFHKDTFDPILEDYRMSETGHSFALPSPEQ